MHFVPELGAKCAIKSSFTDEGCAYLEEELLVMESIGYHEQIVQLSGAVRDQDDQLRGIAMEIAHDDLQLHIFYQKMAGIPLTIYKLYQYTDQVRHPAIAAPVCSGFVHSWWAAMSCDIIDHAPDILTCHEQTHVDLAS